MFSWISICGFTKLFFVLELWLVLIASSDSCVPKSVDINYLGVRSALERYSYYM